MIALVAAAALVAPLLAITAFVHLLYLEAQRLRPRELPALEFFKAGLEERLGLSNGRGGLTFSLVRSGLAVLLTVLVVAATMLRPVPRWQSLLEGLLVSWLLLLIAGYAAPQVLYRRTTAQWLRPLLPLLRLISLAVRPLAVGIEFLQSLAEIGSPEQASDEAPTPEENIDALISAGAEEGLIEESDRELIHSVVAFGDKTVREVMTPRPNIVAIQAEASLEELRELVINEQYSRIPVYEESIDLVAGFLHVRDMFELDEEERRRRRVRELMRPVRFVPETKKVNDLLREMQEDRAHMAIVVDEYGNTAGLVTMEDLVEEVFGEIRDEHEPGLDVTADVNGAYIVSGSFDLDRLHDLVEFRPQEPTESTTVGGLVTEWLGRVPAPGETIERDGIRIEVLAANELRVDQVRVSRESSSAHV